MIQKIKIKRGLKANLPSLDIGEFALCTDTDEIFIGTINGNKPVGLSADGSITDIIDSLINGNIKVNGNEIVVYDDTQIKQSLDNKANISHTHKLSDITDIDLSNKINGYVLTYDFTSDKFVAKPVPGGNGGGSFVSDSTINGNIQIDGVETNVYDDTNLKNSKANINHTHNIGDINNLQTSLDGKSNVGHTHNIGDVTNLQTNLDNKASKTDLDGKANLSHTHQTTDVLGLQSALDGKAPATHTHGIFAITNLQSTLDNKANKTDLDSKANIIHSHTLSNITDVDVTNKANGYALIYDSTLQKTVLKPIPTIDGTGAASLDGLTDVDVTTIAPQEGDVLKNINGIWIPSASSSNLALEDFVRDDVKNLLPNEVKNLSIIDTTKTSIKLSWKPGSSSIKDYIIYSNGSQVDNVTNNEYEIAGLTNSTLYNIIVTTRDLNNIESKGVKISVKTLGNYALSLAKTEYLEVPNIEFTSIDMTLQFTTTKSSWSNCLLTNKTSSKLYSLSSQNNGTQWKRTNFPVMMIDGVSYPDINYSAIPENTKMTIRLDMEPSDIIKDNFNIFGTIDNLSAMTGVLYRVKFYKLNDNGNRDLISDYDFSYQSNGTVSDFFGNNANIILHGGTFIAN